MTLFDSFGESSIPDNPGFKHMLLTWALCAPAALGGVFGAVGYLVEGVFGRGGLDATGLTAVLNVIALPWLLVLHWLFTFAAVVSAATLSFRTCRRGGKALPGSRSRSLCWSA